MTLGAAISIRKTIMTPTILMAMLTVWAAVPAAASGTGPLLEEKKDAEDPWQEEFFYKGKEGARDYRHFDGAFQAFSYSAEGL